MLFRSSMAFVKKYGLKPLNNQMPTKQNTLKLINNAKNKKELRRVKIYLAFLRGNVYIFSKKKGLEKREDNKAYDDLYKNVLKPAIQKKEQQLKSINESYGFNDYDEIYEFENFIIEENITAIDEGLSTTVGVIAGGVLGSVVGNKIGKGIAMKQAYKLINEGKITKATISKGIKECNSKIRLKQMKKTLEYIVSHYPKQEKDPEVRKKHMPLIIWIDKVALVDLIPKKERELSKK